VVALVTAYRRQRVADFAHDLAAPTEERVSQAGEHEQELADRAEERETARLFNERFATAAGQLGTTGPRCGWPGGMRWPTWPMPGPSSGKPA
jgi:hypothetical protein